MNVYPFHDKETISRQTDPDTASNYSRDGGSSKWKYAPAFDKSAENVVRSCSDSDENNSKNSKIDFELCITVIKLFFCLQNELYTILCIF